MQIGRRTSKSKKIEEYILIEGERKSEPYKDMKFKELVDEKRDQRYFLTEVK